MATSAYTATPHRVTRQISTTSVDANAVEDIEGLIAGLRQNVEPCVLDDCSPAIAQMATALRGKVAQVEAIHIIAHGRPGEVSFSAGAVSLETVGAYAADLDLIGRSLGNPGELLLWSCDTGQGAGGAAF